MMAEGGGLRVPISSVPGVSCLAASGGYSTIRAPMDVSHLLDGLNDAQRRGGGLAARLGARARGRRQRQDAGAGASGRVADPGGGRVAAQHPRRHIHQQGGRGNAPAHRDLLGIPGGALWIGTFHGLAHRLLRQHWREAGLPQTFQILDSEDQARLLRKVLKALDLDETRWVPREILWFINAQKDEGVRPKHIKDDGDPTRRQLIRIYQAYEEACQRAGVVDFAELLLRAYEMWRDNPALLQHYRTRFRHVLVDEFRTRTPSSTAG